MRRPGKAGGVLVCVAAAAVAAGGCLFHGADPRSTGWLRGLSGGESGLAVRTVLIDRPAGDSYLSRGLWDSAGKPVRHELAVLLAQNGLRVGVLTGVIPGEFDRLVSSDQSTVDPTHRSLQPGKAKVVPLNGPLERVSYRVLHDLAATPSRVELVGAECGLAITAKPAEGNRVTLLCEPRVQYGDKQGWLQPTTDGSGFTRQERKPLEAYPTLSFEVTLGPQDYLIVGPADDAADTLGQVFFYNLSADRARQRVLVIRAIRGPDVTSAPREPTPR
jgi:hypothetical protein